MFKRKKRIDDKEICKYSIEKLTKEELIELQGFLETLLAWKSKDKLYKTYILGLERALNNTKNNKVYFNYRFDGTVTGRLSCGSANAEEVLGVSFHTLPRTVDKEFNIRSNFIPPENYDLFGTIDFKAAELRVLAHVCKDETMRKAFFSGKDLHKYTASLVFGKTIEQISKEERQIAKAVSFLIVYGGGAYRLAEEVGITETLAQEIIDNLKQAYPGVFIWMEEVESYIREHGYAQSIFGRRRHLPEIFSPIKKFQEDAIKQGVNFCIQSAASDIVLCGLIDIGQELKIRKLESKIAGTVHDSIELYIKKEEAQEVLELCHYKLLNYPYLRSLGFNFTVPLEVEIGIGPAFGLEEEVHFTEKSVIKNLDILTKAI